MHGFRKQITEAKEGPLGLRRKKAKITHLREEEGERNRSALERECVHWVPHPKGFYVFSKSGELRGGLRRGSQNIHQLSRCDLSGSWFLLIGWHLGRGSLVIASGSEVSCDIALSGFVAFLDLKYS